MSTYHSALATTAVGRWHLEPDDSTVEFTGRHFLFLPVQGSFPVREGHVEVAEDGALTRLEAVVSATGFETGNPQRDATVRGPRFLDADRFPALRFTAGPSGAGTGVTGLLEVKGRQVPLTLAVDEPAAEGDRVVVRATARVDRHACGVGALRGLVGGELRVRIRAVLVRRP
ncbi:YceI family protein [Streptomyces althioticus]|uniref:YceI family protein n=1 Tax=Streptomyces althioticus group TaxID=2867194 RepID=UPI001781F550|nr:YceI family protein [Streptomyces althioticus]WTB95149.1 YceI family protein [Streptomyces althioticus]GGQ79201.1 hypothetical protein GCM10010267_47840 [Streptomyces griseorubens]